MVRARTKFCPQVITKFDFSIIFKLKKVNTDELYQLPSPELTDIIEDIEKFWDRADKYKEYGFLHKRGILLYGAPGAGKSGIIQLCTKHLIEKMNGIVINLTNGDQIELYSKFAYTLFWFIAYSFKPKYES